ncbi:MAG: ABC transporter permease [Flavobacteriales bacterium]
MLAKVAWLNIWRNPLRSLVVIVSIILGVWAGLFVMAFSKGMNEQRKAAMIRTSLSHIQVHHGDHVKAEKVGNHFGERGAELQKLLDTLDGVGVYSFRSSINGMASSPKGGGGVSIQGIDPDRESRVTTVPENIIKGHYFDSARFEHPIVVGKALLEKLDLQLHSKLVLRFQGVKGNVVASSYRIVGVFETVSSGFDETHIFIPRKDLMASMGVERPIYHEAAIILEDPERLKGIAARIDQAFPDLEARTWKELSPQLGYADQLMSSMMYIFIGIIMLALAFGIVNSMLMAVLERKRELGMLMAIGMNRTRVFGMILLETLYLSLLSGPLGILFSYGSIEYFGRVGIDLSMVAEGLRSLAVGRIVHPTLDPVFYWNVGGIVILTAFLASIYPARKALKLKPAEAVRTI